MVWPMVAAAAASTALSIYSSSQQAKAAKDAAKARAMANARTARQYRLEAQGRRLINSENLLRADNAILASGSARGIQVDSASSQALMRANRTRMLLDNLSINTNLESRIANLVTDSGAAYRTAALQTKMAGLDALKSMANFGATAAGAMGGAPTTSVGPQTNPYGSLSQMRNDPYSIAMQPSVPNSPMASNAPTTSMFIFR